LPARDAVLAVITHVDGLHDDPMDKVREWKRLAGLFKIPIVEDEERAKQRHAAEMAKVQADFGFDV